MIAAYVDESGNDSTSTVFSMATILLGYTSSYYFANDWRALLSEFGLSAFHATDFYGNRKDFRLWQANRKEDLLNRIISLFHKWEIRHSAQLVAADDFQKSFVDTGFHKTIKPAVKKWTKPYLQAFMWTVLDLREFADHQDQGRVITPIFDNCQEFMGQARKDFDERNIDRKLGRMQVSNTIDHIELQAADFLAWEYRVSAEKFIETGDRTPSAPLGALLKYGFGAKVLTIEWLEYLRKRVEAIQSGLDPDIVESPPGRK